MRFDYTNGSNPKYAVVVSYPTVTDHCYFADMQSSNNFIDRICREHTESARIRLYDIEKDMFVKYLKVK